MNQFIKSIIERGTENKNQDLREARQLEAQARINEAYAAAMENCGGAERSPMTYAAHLLAATAKRSRADYLRDRNWENSAGA